MNIKVSCLYGFAYPHMFRLIDIKWKNYYAQIHTRFNLMDSIKILGDEDE